MGSRDSASLRPARVRPRLTMIFRNDVSGTPDCRGWALLSQNTARLDKNRQISNIRRTGNDSRARLPEGQRFDHGHGETHRLDTKAWIDVLELLIQQSGEMPELSVRACGSDANQLLRAIDALEHQVQTPRALPAPFQLGAGDVGQPANDARQGVRRQQWLGEGQPAGNGVRRDERLAATMLASTLGLDFDPAAAWNERKQIYEHSNLIIESTSITAAAVCGPDNQWTCAIAAAVFLLS